MKGFLFDENLPRRLRFTTSLPTVHSGSLGYGASDERLWEFAKANDLAIVSKDADFAEKAILWGPPPWVVHLRIGNLTRNEMHLFLQRIWRNIEGLLPESNLIEVYLDRIERYEGGER